MAIGGNTPIGGSAGGLSARGAAVNPNTPVRALDLSPLARFALNTQELAELDEAANDRLQAIKAEGAYQRSVQEGLAQLDPLAPNYSESARQLSESASATAQENFPVTNADVQQRLQERLQANIENDHRLAVTTRRGAINDEAVRLADESINQAFEKVRDDPDGLEAYTLELQGQMSGVLEVLPESARQNAIDAGVTKLIEAQIEGLASQGRSEEAKALLDEVGGEFTPASRVQLARRIREIGDTLRNDGSAASAVWRAERKIAISDAASVEELATQRGLVEEAMEEKAITPEQGANLIVSINAKQQSLVKQGRNLTEALQKRNNGTLETRSQADLAYTHEVEQLGAEGEIAPEKRQGHLNQFAADTGFVPTPVFQTIKNAESIEDPQQLATAVTLHRAIRSAAPNVNTGSGDRVEFTSALMDTGMDAVSAAQAAIERTPDRATLAERKEKFRELDVTGDDLALESVGAGGFFDDTQVSADTRRKAEETFQSFFLLTGDEDVARRMTTERLAQTHSVSSLGRDTPTVQEFPPEQFYLPGPQSQALDPAVRDRIILGDAQDLLTELGIEPEAGPEGLPEGAPFILVSDDQTTAGVTTEGQQPSWEIRVRNSFGLYVPQSLTTASGEQVNLRLVAPSQEEFQEIPAYKEWLAEQQASFQAKRQETLAAESAANVGGVIGPLEDSATSAVVGTEPRPEPGPAIPDEQVKEEDDAVSNQRRGNAPAGADLPKRGKTRGIRNNNPGNIERSDTQWRGMSEDQSGDNRFIIFSSPEMGIRAMARILNTYQARHGLNTIDGIVARWAPPSENDTETYARFVADRAGFRRDQRLDLANDEQLGRVIKAMIFFENGSNPYSTETIMEGVKLARR